MKRARVSVLLHAAVMILLVVPAGCAERAVEQESPVLRPLPDCWWESEWSGDGTRLSVSYARGANRLSLTESVGRSYDPFGAEIEGSKVSRREGVDIYGREQNVTIGTPLVRRGARIKPESLAAGGRFTFPPGAALEDTLFVRDFRVAIVYEYDEHGRLESGSGKEEFSGHILTSSGKIDYSGEATATFTSEAGQLLWTKRLEETTYYAGDELYAKTVSVITPQSEYLGGRFVTVRESVETTTTCADGAERRSAISIVWDRNEHGVTTGKSGGGTVSGTDLVRGRSVDYEGSITIDYGFDSQIGWYKTGYGEARTAKADLPKHLPFEVIFIDDPYLSPVF